MTSMWKRAGLAAVLAASAQMNSSAAAQDPLAPLPAPVPASRQPAAKPPAAKPPAVQRPVAAAPAELRNRISAIGRSFDGKAGVSIVSLRDGWEVGWNGNTLFPQQSCSKLWVAISALDAADRGRIRLTDRVSFDRGDLTLFHQPIASKILAGGHSATLDSLLFSAITQSDNTANDKLMRSIGGPQAIRDMIARKNLGAIRFYEGERALQARIAGLTWNPSYSLNGGFYRARSALPMSVRKASFERYIADPYDGAAPHAVTAALARLKRGELLSPASTEKLLSTMGRTKTGAMRVRAALPAGWKWSHKTGTGQDLNGRIGGINDIGLVTAPDGSAYAVAIMSVPSNNSGGSAQKMMRDVTKSLVDWHQANS